MDFHADTASVAVSSKLNVGKFWCGAPVNKYPGYTSHGTVPTVLLELPGNKWEFGFEAEAACELFNLETEGEVPICHVYRSFHRILKGKTSGFETLCATSTSGRSCRLMNLFTKSLQLLKEFALWRASMSFGTEVDPKRDVQWVLTIPAYFNKFAKDFLLKAAASVGMMGDELSSNLMVVQEPVAAAVAVHCGSPKYELLKTGNKIMLLNYGYRSYTISALKVHSLHPLLFSDVALPSDGPVGCDDPLVQFKVFLAELLGPGHFDEQGMKLEFDSIYSEFERLKVIFYRSGYAADLQLVDVLENKKQLVELAAAWNAKHPEKTILITPTMRNGFLTMSNELMLSFFEPSLSAIVTEARRMLSTCPGIRHIAVVGECGDSKVLQTQLRAEFSEMVGLDWVFCDVNPKPQGAVLLGAIYCGLYKDKLASDRVDTVGLLLDNNPYEEVPYATELEQQIRSKDAKLRIAKHEANVQITLTKKLYRQLRSKDAELNLLRGLVQVKDASVQLAAHEANVQVELIKNLYGQVRDVNLDLRRTTHEGNARLAVLRKLYGQIRDKDVELQQFAQQTAAQATVVQQLQAQLVGKDTELQHATQQAATQEARMRGQLQDKDAELQQAAQQATSVEKYVVEPLRQQVNALQEQVQALLRLIGRSALSLPDVASAGLVEIHAASALQAVGKEHCEHITDRNGQPSHPFAPGAVLAERNSEEITDTVRQGLLSAPLLVAPAHQSALPLPVPEAAAIVGPLAATFYPAHGAGAAEGEDTKIEAAGESAGDDDPVYVDMDMDAVPLGTQIAEALAGDL